MSKVDEALKTLAQIADPTERALELAGLLSTLFKLRDVALVVTGELAYNSYADTPATAPELELAAFAGKLTPRLLQDVMVGQLRAAGSVSRWSLLGIPIRFHFESGLILRNLCRDFQTKHGTVKLWPAEELTAERVLAAVFPSSNPVARGEALTLLTQGLVDAFQMNWIALRELCHRPEYRVGEELSVLRMEAKQEADARGLSTDPVGYGPAADTQRLFVGDLPASGFRPEKGKRKKLKVKRRKDRGFSLLPFNFFLLPFTFFLLPRGHLTHLPPVIASGSLTA